MNKYGFLKVAWQNHILYTDNTDFSVKNGKYPSHP